MDEMLSENLTSNQKNTVYTEMLIPMKNKISQILLYDTTAAAEFLAEYNKIISNTGLTVGELMNAINSLEISIQAYEQTTGKEKIVEEKGKILSKDIRDLTAKSLDLTTSEFESEFLKFRKGYDLEIINQSYQDRENIDKEFYNLQANLIMRKVAENRSNIDLGKIIKEQDKQFLGIWVRQRTNELKPNQNLSEFANKINEMLLLKEDAVLIPELWEWLNAAEKGKEIPNKKEEIKALIPKTEEKQLTFFDKLAKRFSRKPTFPLDIRDIKKIDIEWITTQIPKEMQIETERERLKKDRKVADNIYNPSSKFVVFQKMQEILKTSGERKRKDILYGENNVNIEIKTSQNTSSFRLAESFAERGVDTRMSIEMGERTERVESRKPLADVLLYAEWLDKISGSSFKQEVLKEIKEYFFDKKINETKCINRLIFNLDKLSTEFENNKLDVFTAEEEKRERFYKEHPPRKEGEAKTENIIARPKLKPDSDQHIEPYESFERI